MAKSVFIIPRSKRLFGRGSRVGEIFFQVGKGIIENMTHIIHVNGIPQPRRVGSFLKPSEMTLVITAEIKA